MSGIRLHQLQHRSSMHRSRQSTRARGSWPSADTGRCSDQLTMQILNERLSTYLEEVRSLEQRNKQLQLNIWERSGKETVETPDFSRSFAAIAALRAEISKSVSENRAAALRIDNNRITAQELRIRYEAERGLRSAVERDAFGLRKVRDDLTLSLTDLEMTAEGLREELMTQRREREQETRALQEEETPAVSVQVEAGRSESLTEALREVRQRYEAVLRKNKRELECWYQTKVESLRRETVSSAGAGKTTRTELQERRRTRRSLEIELQAARAQENLTAIASECGATLRRRQEEADSLQEELRRLKRSLREAQLRHSPLLSLTTRLETEITEYRQLLEGEQEERKSDEVVCKVTEELQESQQHMEKRVKTIVEEIIDGQVASDSEKTRVHTIQ